MAGGHVVRSSSVEDSADKTLLAFQFSSYVFRVSVLASYRPSLSPAVTVVFPDAVLEGYAKRFGRTRGTSR